MYQRGTDGYAVDPKSGLRNTDYPPIPDASQFQHHASYRYETPKAVHGWQWSTTFNRWGAIVEFADGWKGLTWPAPWRKHHDDCPVCEKKLTRHSPNGFDVIYECDSHHRHIIKGISGEYISMRPVSFGG